MRSPFRRLWLSALLAVFGCDGCGERPGAEAVEATETPSETPTTEAPSEPSGARGPVATLRGVVRLAEGQEPPRFTSDELGATGQAEESCSPPKITDRAPLELGMTRGLSNVVVTLTADDRQAFFERVPGLRPERHEVFVRDCRLDPRVVVAAPGDVIVLENEMFYPFLPTTNSTAFLRGLIKDQPQEVPVERVGLMPITCGMMAGCGRTDVVIAATRLSTVTGEDGAFVLENVPAGLALHVHAWHPLLQEGVVDVTLEAGAETPVEVSVSSRAAPATPEPTEPSGENPPTPEGPAENTSPLF